MIQRLEEDEGVPETLRSSKALRQIAAVLDLPVSALFAPEGERSKAIAETSELIMAFNAIRDPEARARCLAFVRALGTEKSD